MSQNLIKQADIQKIAAKGSKIYRKIKGKYEPQKNGKFLAIDTATKDTYLGNTSAEALEKATTSHPGRVFFVVKIGFDSVETMAQAIIHSRNK